MPWGCHNEFANNIWAEFNKLFIGEHVEIDQI